MAELHTEWQHREHVKAFAQEMTEAEMIGTHVAAAAAIDVLRELERRGITLEELNKLVGEIALGQGYVNEVATARGINLPPIEVMGRGTPQ